MEKKVDTRHVYDLKLSDGSVGLRVDGDKVFIRPHHYTGGFITQDSILAKALIALMELASSAIEVKKWESVSKFK